MFPYEGKLLSASLQHRRPTSYLHKEIHKVFVFVLPIRNKSPFSGKIITSFKIERMSLYLLAIWPKHKIEMQIMYDDRYVQVRKFVFQGLNIGKWSTGKRCDGVAVVKNVKTIVSKRWHPSFNIVFLFVVAVFKEVFMTRCYFPIGRVVDLFLVSAYVDT